MNGRPRTLFTQAALASSLALLPLALHAQTEDQSAIELESYEVVGSRISGADVARTSAVVSISSDDIRDSGIKSIGELLGQLSASGSSLNTKFNSAGNFGFPADGGGVGSGSTTVSLRHLDARRTLVLVDGLRWVNESSASGVSAAVDLNTIPIAAIERIEVLPDGASSLYGSDAIAGVVNIVTKKTGEGLVLDLYTGDYETGDGNTQSASLSFGGTTERLSFFTDFSYYNQDGISSGDWEQSSYPVPGGGLAFGSSAIPTTRTIFVTDGNDYGGLCPDGVCNIAGNGTAADGVPEFPTDFHRFSSADRYNFAPYNLLLTPSERKSIFSQVQYKLRDNIDIYGRALFQNRVSANQAAPEPIFIGPANGSGLIAEVTVDVTNPYNPFGVTLDGASNLISAARRPVEGEPRVFTQDVNTLYFSGGFKGDFTLASLPMRWDLNFISGTNDATQTVEGTYNLSHIQRALGPLDNCTGPCVPLNFFGGPGTITDDMLGYIGFVEQDRSNQQINGVSANINGQLATLPAGPLMFASGYESRHLSGSYSPDAIVVAGEGNGVPSAPTQGGYSIDEFYGELSVPVLADLPGIRTLDLSLAARYSDYSNFGDTTNAKYGLRWQPFAELTLRSTYAEGFRAPSIGELYASNNRFDAQLRDPCSEATDPAILSNCAALGVPAGYEQVSPQIGVDTGGNPDLDPETSESISAGFVYSPAWASKLGFTKRLDLEMTWYSIEVTDAIQARDAQTQLDRCVETLDPDFCEGIVRNEYSAENPTGSGDIVAFENQLQNLGTIKTEGFDSSLSWNSSSTGIGSFNATLIATYVSKFESIASDSGLAEPREVGIEVNDSGIPRIKGQLRTGWLYDRYSVNWTVRYIGELKEYCDADTGTLSTCSDPDYDSSGEVVGGTNTLGETFYHDLRLAYTVPGTPGMTLALGVNNLFGEEPPVCVSCSLNGYDASNYDLPGTYSYLQAILRY